MYFFLIFKAAFMRHYFQIAPYCEQLENVKAEIRYQADRALGETKIVIKLSIKIIFNSRLVASLNPFFAIPALLG